MSEGSNNPEGAPTKYKPGFNEQVYKLCLLGATDKDIADFFEVCEATINNWKLEYPEFLESLKRAKDEADSKVVRSLYERATGYSHPEEKVFCYEGDTFTHDTVKHYPPDTTACIFWLKNRQSENWKDKQETELTGPGGGPIQTKIISEIVDPKERE